MPKIRLIDREIKNIALSKERTDYWDSELVGLCLRVRPTGRKSWVVKHRGGFTGLGTYPTVSAAQARNSARQAIARAALGIEAPTTETAHRATVGELWAQYVARSDNGERRNREGIGRLYVLPVFSQISVVEVKSAQIDTIVRSLSNKPRTGTAVKRHLHGAFELAKILNMFPEDKSNPAAKVKGYAYKPRSRFLSDVELSKVGTALLDCRQNRIFELLHAELVILLLLTGARVGEFVSAKWDMLDENYPALVLHEHKTMQNGIKRLELGTRAFTLMQVLPRRSDYIFYGRAGVGRITEATRPWGVIRAMANISHATIHDLRRTFASVAANSGMQISDIGILLGHKELSATGIYAIADIHRRQKLINEAESVIYSRLFSELVVS